MNECSATSPDIQHGCLFGSRDADISVICEYYKDMFFYCIHLSYFSNSELTQTVTHSHTYTIIYTHKDAHTEVGTLLNVNRMSSKCCWLHFCRFSRLRFSYQGLIMEAEFWERNTGMWTITWQLIPEQSAKQLSTSLMGNFHWISLTKIDTICRILKINVLHNRTIEGISPVQDWGGVMDSEMWRKKLEFWCQSVQYPSDPNCPKTSLSLKRISNQAEEKDVLKLWYHPEKCECKPVTFCKIQRKEEDEKATVV